MIIRKTPISEAEIRKLYVMLNDECSSKDIKFMDIPLYKNDFLKLLEMEHL